jgi:phage tail P2-like protein
LPDHLLPPSATENERQLSLAADRATALPVDVRDVWSPEACPSQILPWLAWAFGVESWDVTWTDQQKRAAIAASLPVKRVKGTIGAVRKAVASMGLQAEVVEWFNQLPPGNPYTYDLIIEAEQAGFGEPQFRLLLDLVDRTKNVRSHLDELILQVVSHSTLYTGGAALIGLDITLPYEGDIQPPAGDTLLLLHAEAGDAPAGALKDSSPFDRPVQLHGGAVVDPDIGYFDHGLFLPGNGYASSSLAQPLGSEPFTIEFFARPVATPGDGARRFVQLGAPGTDGSVWIAHRTEAGVTTLVVHMWTWGNEYVAITAPALPALQWSHVALVRSGAYRLYVDGAFVAEEGTAEGGPVDATDVWVGASGAGTDLLHAHIDELRISAVARYDGPFMPPAAPFPS